MLAYLQLGFAVMEWLLIMAVLYVLFIRKTPPPRS